MDASPETYSARSVKTGSECMRKSVRTCVAFIRTRTGRAAATSRPRDVDIWRRRRLGPLQPPFPPPRTLPQQNRLGDPTATRLADVLLAPRAAPLAGRLSVVSAQNRRPPFARDNSRSGSRYGDVAVCTFPPQPFAVRAVVPQVSARRNSTFEFRPFSRHFMGGCDKRRRARRRTPEDAACGPRERACKLATAGDAIRALWNALGDGARSRAGRMDGGQRTQRVRVRQWDAWVRCFAVFARDPVG